jgi:membrane associated rhomboid family serine protease
MRGRYHTVQSLTGGMTDGVRTLLIINAAVFLLQVFSDRVMDNAFSALFSLNHAAVRALTWWQFFTYMFLHGHVLHLVFNLLILFFIGPETERAMGRRQFYITYFVSGVLGGLGWVLMSSHGDRCLGASAAILGILGAFAALFPQRPVTLLLFFVLPVTVKAWVMVAGLAAVEFLMMFTHPASNVAYSAHLAGGIAGFVYTRIVFRGGAAALERLWRSRRRPALRMSPAPPRPPRATPTEVDVILEKIAHQGLGSLSPRERAILDRASQQLRSPSEGAGAGRLPD